MESNLGFHWGVSSSAYQIEGGWDSDGKGKSIWDEFSLSKNKIYAGQNAKIACNYYEFFEQDINLMSQLKIKNYRFSIAWSRIIPLGTGKVNQAGIDFYNRVINHCLKRDIVPWVTLYHWDLPNELEKKGGWTNREIINWFGNYVSICMGYFGDRVKNWIILNEPMVFTGAGYFLGIHAPGKKGLRNFLAATHHATLCQAEGGRIVRQNVPNATIGTSFSCSLIHPKSESFKDLEAAKRIDALVNRLFIEPLAGLNYPTNDLKFLNRLEPFIKDGDEAKMAFNMDFIGIQNYTREVVSHSWRIPLLWAKAIKASKRKVDITELGWEIYPESMYSMLHKFDKYKNFKEIIVTENGAAFKDEVTKNEVKDPKRIEYLSQNINQLLKAKKEGVKVNGYFVWSFTDNFEWAEGFRPRFGLVFIDFATQERIIKDSGYWYSNFIQQLADNNSLTIK